MHFYGWKKGLKTGMYYLRTRPAVDAIKFTVDAGAVKREVEAERAAAGAVVAEEEQTVERDEAAALMCSLQNREACEMCSG